MTDGDIDPTRFHVEVARPRGFGQAFVREGAGGVPIVLLHGWPETRRIWQRNIAPLAAAGFEVIAPDLRGFGDSEVGPDGFQDVPTHARDIHALVADHLGHARAVLVAGDLGGAVALDLALRFPDFAHRLVLFNAPVPYDAEAMAGFRTRGHREAADYFLRQGRDADALAAELATPGERRRYIASFYTSRFWAHPGSFDEAAVNFHAEPFEDAAKLRASFGAYERVFAETARSEPPMVARQRRIGAETLILFGASDHVMPPEWDRMAAVVCPNHTGPFLVRDAGHFLQWEAADVLNGAIRSFCRDLLAARRS
jgi:pimeloyl-ACP methyl ester carboxylesterase